MQATSHKTCTELRHRSQHVFTMLSISLGTGVRYASLPPQRGETPFSPPPSSWDLPRAHGMSFNNQILHGDQTRCEDNFYKVDHEC